MYANGAGKPGSVHNKSFIFITTSLMDVEAVICILFSSFAFIYPAQFSFQGLQI
jgi:hypothetical protein